MTPNPLNAEETRRYGRHLVLPEVGLAGQARLKKARVLLVGAGGLGSPAALYLAAAGVGTLGLVDFDHVELTNLQRQILYGERDLGRPKVEAAQERLGDVNPQIRLVPHHERLDRENVFRLLEDYDLVVDGSDNFPTRYLVNDACVIAGKPDVWGAVARFEGQVAVFGGPEGPCYRCLFPEPPPPGLVPSCAEGGVLGVLPGIIGALQANEAIKWILGLGESLHGRLAIFDALRFHWRQLQVTPAPSCPLCSLPAEDRRILDMDAEYCLASSEMETKDAFAAKEEKDVTASPPSAESSEASSSNQTDQEKLPMSDPIPFEIDVETLAAWLKEGRELNLLDVREPHEAEICQIEGSQLLPLRELPQRFSELDPETLWVVHCHHGPRSGHAVMFLRQQGFERATNLTGGIDAWSLRIDPAVPRY